MKVTTGARRMKKKRMNSLTIAKIQMRWNHGWMRKKKSFLLVAVAPTHILRKKFYFFRFVPFQFHGIVSFSIFFFVSIWSGSRKCEWLSIICCIIVINLVVQMFLCRFIWSSFFVVIQRKKNRLRCSCVCVAQNNRLKRITHLVICLEVSS